MIYYVTASNAVEAKQITEQLQQANLSDCYISPLTAISCLGSINIPFEDKMALRLDLLTVCDALIVAASITDEMRSEIALAKLIKMEVIYLDS